MIVYYPPIYKIWSVTNGAFKVHSHIYDSTELCIVDWNSHIQLLSYGLLVKMHSCRKSQATSVYGLLENTVIVF